MLHNGEHSDLVDHFVVSPQIGLVIEEKYGRHNPCLNLGFCPLLVANRGIKSALCKSQVKLNNLLTIKVY